MWNYKNKETENETVAYLQVEIYLKIKMKKFLSSTVDFLQIYHLLITQYDLWLVVVEVFA